MRDVTTEQFDGSPKPSATPIFRPQGIRENYFQLRKTPKIAPLRGWGSVLENSQM